MVNESSGRKRGAKPLNESGRKRSAITIAHEPSEEIRAAKAAAAEAAEAERKAELKRRGGAAIVVQKYSRGKAGRAKAEATCPPCVEACKRFVIDKQAAEFGTCVCGFKKEGHSKRALAQGSAKLKRMGSVELRKKMVQREKADCTEFRVNMDPSLPFGTCMCGRPRAEHTAAALAAKSGMGTTR